MVVPAEGIDTTTGPAALLDLIRLYRQSKLSDAIKTGLQRARASGKCVGRPPIPESVRSRIVAARLGGAGVRSCARQFNVSPGSVVAIFRQEMV